MVKSELLWQQLDFANYGKRVAGFSLSLQLALARGEASYGDEKPEGRDH